VAQSMMCTGTDINVLDKHGQTPLANLSCTSNEELIDNLLHGELHGLGAASVTLLANQDPMHEEERAQDWEKGAK